MSPRTLASRPAARQAVAGMRCTEQGQGTIEYLGGLVAVAAVITLALLVVRGGGLAGAVERGASHEVACVLRLGGCGGGSRGGGPAGGGPTGGGSPLNPHAPWIVSDPQANEECPAGYDFHVTTDRKMPWCANAAIDPHPGQLLEDPYQSTVADYHVTIPQLECSTGGACMYFGSTEWTSAVAYADCLDEGGDDCRAPKELPAFARVIPGDPNSGWQVFPYGLPQARAYVQYYDQLIEKLGDLQDAANQTLEQRERLEAAGEALAEVDTPAAIAYYQSLPPEGGEVGGDGEDDPMP